MARNETEASASKTTNRHADKKAARPDREASGMCFMRSKKHTYGFNFSSKYFLTSSPKSGRSSAKSIMVFRYPIFSPVS